MWAAGVVSAAAACPPSGPSGLRLGLLSPVSCDRVRVGLGLCFRGSSSVWWVAQGVGFVCVRFVEVFVGFRFLRFRFCSASREVIWSELWVCRRRCLRCRGGR